MERLRKRKGGRSSSASVLAAGAAKRTRLAELTSVGSASSILEQKEQRVDEEHLGVEVQEQQMGQIDSTVLQRLSSDPVTSRAPSQSEVSMPLARQRSAFGRVDSRVSVTQQGRERAENGVGDEEAERGVVNNKDRLEDNLQDRLRVGKEEQEAKNKRRNEDHTDSCIRDTDGGGGSSQEVAGDATTRQPKHSRSSVRSAHDASHSFGGGHMRANEGQGSANEGQRSANERELPPSPSASNPNESQVPTDSGPGPGPHLARLGENFSTGPLATWIDGVIMFGGLLLIIAVCNNIAAIIVFFLIYNHLAENNADMRQLVRRESIVNCWTRIGLRFLAILLYLHTACVDHAMLPVLDHTQSQVGGGDGGSTWLLRFTGFQHVSGQDLLTHFYLGNLRASMPTPLDLVFWHNTSLAANLPTSIKDINDTSPTSTRATPLSSTNTHYGEAKWTCADMLRLLALGDAIVCYLAMFFKAILVEVALAHGGINRRRVGYLLELEEAFLSLYRQLLPIATWLRAFKTSTTCGPLAAVFSVFYLMIKFKTWVSTAKLAYVALNALTRNRLPYGKLLPEKMPRVDAEVARADGEFAPVDAADAECAICRDVLTTPVELSCGHIFCDACLVDWLESTRWEGTCPLCRRVVQPSHLHMSLKGGAWLFPHLF